MKKLDYQGTQYVHREVIPDDPPPCPTCHGAQWVLRGRFDPEHPPTDWEETLQPCPTCYAATYHQLEFAKLVGESGLADERDVTFAAIEPYDYQQEAYEVAKSFGDVPHGPSWLWLYGDSGSGKTLLAQAIGNAFLDGNETVLFRDTEEILDWLREGFHPKAEQSPWSRFEALKQVQLLVLDEFNPIGATAWAAKKLDQILNYRWHKRKPLVVTTNLAIEQLDMRMKSRVRDTTMCRTIRLDPPHREE